MRTIAVIISACLLALKDIAADKDKPLVILAGELKQITDAVKVKVDAAPAADPVIEVYDSYSRAANQHGAGIQFTISARKLQVLTALLPESAKVEPSKPPTPASTIKP